MEAHASKTYEMEDYDPKVTGSVEQTEIHISETGEGDIMRARCLTPSTIGNSMLDRSNFHP